MRICIFGAGAVGSHFAVRLATPMLDVIAGLAIRRARDKGLYPAVHPSRPSS
jgi:ketopantoate reductase